MPELPEVETVRRGLEDNVVGRRIERVDIGRERTVRRTSRSAVIDGLTGATIMSASRRGKYLLCPLDTGDCLMVHLRMSGQLLLANQDTVRPAHTHMIARLAADDRHAPADLLFVDARTFGEVVVFDPDHADIEMPELGRLGVDPIADPFGVSDVRAMLRGRRTRIKPLLLDQHVVAGIGNIYSDEILHAARIHPDRPAYAVGRGAEVRLHDAIVAVLNAGIEARGSTLSDGGYVDLMGDGGSYQNHHLVYGRTGQRCLTCRRGTVRRGALAGRGYHFCPVCQRPLKAPSSPRAGSGVRP